MNAEYIYNIFEVTERSHDHDLLIGMAKLMTSGPGASFWASTTTSWWRLTPPGTWR